MSKPIEKVTILHGYGVTPRSMWFPWLHAELEKHGLGVNVPALPDPFRPSREKWLKAAAPLARQWDSSTVVIGHSLGGVLALRLLETEALRRIRALVIVSSPFASTIKVQSLVHFFDRPVNWLAIQGGARDIHLLQAKDDPLVPYDHSLRYRESLDAHLSLVKSGGHLTAKTCPPLMKLLKPYLQ